VARTGAALTLARAFQDDAMFRYIEPDEDRRRRVLPWFFGAALRLGRHDGRVDELAGSAAAIWLVPGRTTLGPRALLRSGLAAAPLRLGLPAFRRFTALTGAFEREARRAMTSPYWHLFILGVDPEHQGRGHGGRLIAPVLAEADRTELPCYVETTEEPNTRFYERHGFTTTVHRAGADLPEFWTMTRAPR
jgi:ribosomal protein S18 acetylase RimI-like enzyme